jgi:hypothetical protein
MIQDAGSANQSGRIYTAVKRAPSRCPGCLCPFDGIDTHWTVNPGASRPGVQGPFETAALFPEIWKTTRDDSDRPVTRWQELPGYEVQFISCRRCDNVTISVDVDQRSFRTPEQAEALCRDEGFTFVREGLVAPGSETQMLALVQRDEAERRIPPRMPG